MTAVRGTVQSVSSRYGCSSVRYGMNRMEAHGFVRVSAAAARLAVTEEASKGSSERPKKRACRPCRACPGCRRRRRPRLSRLACVGIGVGRVYTPSASRRPRGARRAGRSPQRRRRRPDRTPRFQRVGRLRSGRWVQLRILVRRKHTLGVSCHQPRQHATYNNSLPYRRAAR